MSSPYAGVHRTTPRYISGCRCVFPVTRGSPTADDIFRELRMCLPRARGFLRDGADRAEDPRVSSPYAGVHLPQSACSWWCERVFPVTRGLTGGGSPGYDPGMIREVVCLPRCAGVHPRDHHMPGYIVVSSREWGFIN
jgi:hypothetical protein